MQQFMSLTGTGAGAVVREIGIDVPDGLTPGKDIFTEDFARTLVPFEAGVAEGWVQQADGTYAPPPAAPQHAVPDIISDRQFFQQLAVDGDITEDEALAAVMTGTLPKKLADAIASLPADQQFPAKMLVCGETQFQRSNAMVPVLGQALGKDAAALDAIWSAAIAL